MFYFPMVSESQKCVYLSTWKFAAFCSLAFWSQKESYSCTQEKKKKSDLVASVVEIQEQVGLWHNLMEMPPTFHTISDRTVALSQMAFLMIQVSIFPQEYQATVKCEYTNNFIWRHCLVSLRSMCLMTYAATCLELWLFYVHPYVFIIYFMCWT